jgi:hypothetical protein
MDQGALTTAWHAEERIPFSGWDFSRLEGRVHQDPEPWSYQERVIRRITGASAVLDMDTGGGERLLSLRPYWPARVIATESYPPNVAVARERLSRLGVAVVQAGREMDQTLPFRDGAFDLILNRHGAFKSSEIDRLLMPSGIFVTQQVHDLDLFDLQMAFAVARQEPQNTLERCVLQLESDGLHIIDAQDWTGKTSFTDVGAVVYFLKAIPWIVPGFSVDTHLAALLALQVRLERGQSLTFTIQRFLVEAEKHGARYPV